MTPRTYTLAQQHRLGFILDIYDGMESISQELIEAGNGFALYGAKPPYSEALIDLCAAPHIAAIDAGAWEGNPEATAIADICRVMEESRVVNAATSLQNPQTCDPVQKMRRSLVLGR